MNKPAQFYIPLPDCQVRGVDALYQASFGARRNGTFVEIGAFDGRSFSNTAFLADLGWQGLYVEPVPAYAEACAHNHRDNPNVKVVTAAAGRAAGTLRMQVAGVLSTGSDEVFAVYQTLPWAKADWITGETVEVPVLPLEAILRSEGIQPKFELLVVDVEGLETEVFAGFDLDHWRPRMLIVELEEQHPIFAGRPGIAARAASLRQRIKAAGYAEIYVDEVNTVFCDLAASDTPWTKQLTAERDAYRQALFESDRHAAWLARERQRLIDRQDALVEQHKERHAELTEQLAQHLRQIDQHKEEIDLHQLQIREIYASTSWRLTRPVRAVKRLMLRLRGR